MRELIEEVIADGVVDAAEVTQLREAFYADGVIDEEEVRAIFEINDAVSGNDNDASFTTLFADVVSAFVLEDEETPGVVDEDEANLIVELMEGDGQIDANEVAALTKIKAEAKIIHPTLGSLIEANL